MRLRFLCERGKKNARPKKREREREREREKTAQNRKKKLRTRTTLSEIVTQTNERTNERTNEQTMSGKRQLLSYADNPPMKMEIDEPPVKMETDKGKEDRYRLFFSFVLSSFFFPSLRRPRCAPARALPRIFFLKGVIF